MYTLLIAGQEARELEGHQRRDIGQCTQHNAVEGSSARWTQRMDIGPVNTTVLAEKRAREFEGHQRMDRHNKRDVSHLT